MAVTSIWRVHGSVGKVLDYVENAEKTTAVSTGDGDLSDVIDYAIQQHKTSQTQMRDGEEVVQRFVSGINCNPRTAKMEMQKIKKFYGKEDGVIAYHGYQSFAPGGPPRRLPMRLGSSWRGSFGETGIRCLLQLIWIVPTICIPTLSSTRCPLWTASSTTAPNRIIRKCSECLTRSAKSMACP